MQTHKSSLVFLLMIAVLSSFLLVPGNQEQALMFLKDRQLDRAENIYKSLQVGNRFSRNNLTPLNHIYLERGDVASATQLHEQYLAQNLDDIEVWENLLQLYRESLKPFKEVDALEQVVARYPSVNYYEQLISLYEDLGISDKRLPIALEKVIELDPSREKELKQLISILASSGQEIDANKYLDQYVSRFPEKVNKNIAELRLRLLLLADRKKDAYAWAKIWLSDHQNLSQRYLALLYSNGESSSLNVALAYFDIIEFSAMPVWLVDMFMHQDWAGKKQEVLKKFVAHLDDDKRRHYPVIMTSLAIKKKDKIEIEKWLALAESKADLTQDQRVSLMLSYFKLGRVSKAMHLLSGLAEPATLSDMQFSQAVKSIINAGRVVEGVAVFQSLRERRQEQDFEAVPALDEAWLLLASAAGETKKVSQWLEDQGDRKISTGLLTNLYYAAADRKRFRLASVFGRGLYLRTPEKREARLLVEALSGLKRRTLKEHVELVSLLNFQVTNFRPTRIERRAIAFQLLRIGEKRAAEEQFMRLAKNQVPQGKDVAQLLFLWGSTPASAVLDWLQMRARTAPAHELASWWQYLIQTGGAEIVVDMSVGRAGSLSVEAENELVNAFIAMKDFSGLDKKLIELSENTGSKKRLELLVAHASSANLINTEKRIWKKLSEVQPKHSKAMRELGVAAFDRGELLVAGEYLTQYLSLAKGDWEAALYLGDISQAYGKEGEAQLNYKKSLMLIGDKLSGNKTKGIAQAYLLSQLGNTKKAMSLYDKLIVAYPEDLALRVKYTDLLLDEGHLKKAQQLLVEK